MVGDDMSSMWDRLRDLDTRHNDLSRQVAGHLSACDVRHHEIVRRQEESAKDRGNLRAEMAAGFATTNGKLEAQNDMQNKKITENERNNFRLWLTVAGAVIVGLINVAVGVLPYLIGKGG